MSTATAVKIPSGEESLSEGEVRAWRGLLRAHACLAKRLDASLEQAHGLPMTSYEVLQHLQDASEGRMRMCDLAEQAQLSRSGLTRLVDRLEREELLERCSCEHDARGAYACLTDLGRARLRAARGTHLAGTDPAQTAVAPPLAHLTLSTTPAGALVEWGGKTMGATPLELDLLPGPQTLKVTADGKGLAPWQLRRIVEYLDAHLPERVDLAHLRKQVKGLLVDADAQGLADGVGREHEGRDRDEHADPPPQARSRGGRRRRTGGRGQRRSWRCLHATHRVARGNACRRAFPIGLPHDSHTP